MFFPKNLSDQEIFAGFLTLHDILTAAPWVHLVCVLKPWSILQHIQTQPGLCQFQAP